MKKAVLILGALALTACAGGTPPKGDPGPPPKQEIVEKQVIVPVVCQATVTKPQIDINSAPSNVPLEEQNATLRSTIAQLFVYINDLASGFQGCGGKIK